MQKEGRIGKYASRNLETSAGAHMYVTCFLDRQIDGGNKGVKLLWFNDGGKS
jgi:hypothetical protein